MAPDPPLTGRPSRADFDEVVAAYAPRVYAFVHRLVGGEDAEDAAQDVWIAVYRALPSYRGHARFSTWLFGVAVRVCGKRRRRRRLAQVEEAAAANLASGDPSPETAALRRELAAVVRHAIDLLPPGQREAVHLRQLEECSYAEIAAILNVPLGTVRSRLHLGMARLTELLTPYVVEPAPSHPTLVAVPGPAPENDHGRLLAER